MKDERGKMKDYPDRMTAIQARRFGEDVLNIVSQIPCACKDGGKDAEVFAWGR